MRLGWVLICRRREGSELVLVLVLVVFVFVFVRQVDGVGVLDAATRSRDVRFIGPGHAAAELLRLVGVGGLHDTGRGDQASARIDGLRAVLGFQC